LPDVNPPLGQLSILSFELKHRADTMTELNEVIPESRKREAAIGIVRQTVEFITVLSVSTLLLRTIAAEAYIVLTGAMAPTLLGNHREVVCPNCGYRFPLGQDDEERAGRALCPNCGQNHLDDAPSVACSGDRVLVQKFLYDFRPPKRWEVAVFHFPNEPNQAYVKRVVALPGEEVRIVGGNIEIDGKIARKSLKEQRAMRMLVYDHRYQPKDSTQFPRWAFRKGARGDGLVSGWKPLGTRFIHESTGNADNLIDWLEYRHWDPDRHRYSPIYDFNAYNGGDLRGENQVNDLMLAARLNPSPELDAVVVRLNSGSDAFLISIGVKTAKVEVKRLRRNGSTVELSNVRNPLASRSPTNESWLLEASVMDRRLIVAIDGELLFDPIDYDDPEFGQGPRDNPIALGVRGGGKLVVSDLRIFRDIHYTSTLANTPRRPFAVDSPYRLGPDDYFVLGDNSPVSNDSRFWAGSPVVPASMLLGKPFLVHLPGQVVPLQVFGRSVYWVPDPREIRYIR